MTRFTYKGKTYYIGFICSYGGALSRSGNPASDFRLVQAGCFDGRRISTDTDYPKHSLERTAIAAIRRSRHNEFRQWAIKNGFTNTGSAARFAHS